MATTTLQNLRRELATYLGYSEQLGKDGSAWTTTSNIGSSATIISTELRDYGFDDIGAAGTGDDSFENWWIITLGSNNSQTVRRVKAYDASVGQLTLTGTNLSAESSSTDFEIHKYSPSLLRELLNTARVQVFPLLYQPLTKSLYSSRGQSRYEVPSSIVGRPVSVYLEEGLHADFENNVLSNADFETFASSAFTSWTTTTLDIAQEESSVNPYNVAVHEGSSAAQCTSQTGSQGILAQTLSSASDYSGQRLNLSVWVYCLTASVVSTRIYLNSSETLGTANDGGLHTGTGWELLTATVDAPVTVSSLTAGVSVVSTATDNTEFYVDDAILTIGPVGVPSARPELLQNWEWVPMQEGTNTRNHLVFPYEIPQNRKIRVEGRGYLSSVSGESDVMEIGKPQTDLLYAYAANELYRRTGQSTPDSEGRYDLSRQGMALADMERLEVHAMKSPRRRLNIPDWGI